MKKLLILLFFFPLFVGAQNISVKSFKLLEKDLDAQTYFPKTDQNGDKCAIIKVQTTETGFQWEGDGLGIIATEYKTGEFWIYVPFGAQRLTIKHPKLGVLRNYQYTQKIQSGKVYEMVLTTARVTTIVEEYEIPTQWVVITSEPSGVNIYINEEHKGITPFQQELAEGTYNYRLQYPMYHEEAGRFELVASEGKKAMNMALKPNFGMISVSSKPESGATVLLDGKPTGKTTPCTLEQISSGQHTVSLQREWYQPITKQVTVNDAQTSEVAVEMQPNFANVKITAKNNAVIFIDGTRKATATWEGRLLAGFHTFEAKIEKYKDDKSKVEIVAGEEKSINLEPQPKLGKLKIISNPFDAIIKLNGKEYGKTPLTINDLLIGSYTLELSKIGFTTYSKTIEIKENETGEVKAELLKGMEVSFASTPIGAKVIIDGKEMGITPCKIGLEEGAYKVTYQKINYKSLEKSIRVDQYSRNFSEDLEGKIVKINISSTPSGAKVIIKKSALDVKNTSFNSQPGKNKLELGNTNTSFNFQAGTYILELDKQGFATYSEIVNFADRQGYKINLLPAQKRSKGAALLLSAVWPGAGQTYLNRGGAVWLSGVLVYGLGAASYSQRVKAVEAYNNYQAADDVTLRNQYVTEAETAYNTSQTLMYAAIGAWGVNMIWTMLVPSDSKRFKNVKPTANYNSQNGTLNYGLAIKW